MSRHEASLSTNALHHALVLNELLLAGLDPFTLTLDGVQRSEHGDRRWMHDHYAESGAILRAAELLSENLALILTELDSEGD